MRDDTQLMPLAHGPAYVFSRHASHRGKVTLADLMVQQNPAAADVLADVIHEIEQCASQASFDTEKCRRGYGIVSVSQPPGQGSQQILRKLRMPLDLLLELGSADEQERAFRNGDHRRGARSAINHRKFANDSIGPEQRDRALLPVKGCDDDFGQPCLYLVTAIAGIAGAKQGFALTQVALSRTVEELRKHGFGSLRQYIKKH